jgi:HK97 family phage major capsid protein
MTDIKELMTQFTGDVETKMQKMATELNTTSAILRELEQKMEAGTLGGGEGIASKTWGSQVVGAPELKEFADFKTRPSRVSFEVKAITSGSSSAGALYAPQRDMLSTLPQQRLTIRDLLPTIQVTSGSVEYPKQTTRTNNAATVAEGVTKAESALAYDLTSVPIRTIAHWVTASRQILEDAPQLQGIIDTELTYGLKLVEEGQLLNGGGTGTDLSGIYTQATAFAPEFTMAAPNMIDIIGLAVLQQALTNLPADGIVLSEADWTRIRMIKDADGRYIMGDPGAEVSPRIFGLPVVASQSMTADKFMVGSFQQSATLYDRWEARVEVSTEDSDNFRKNLVTILAEERIGLAVKKTLGFTKGDFSDAITAATAA